MRFFGTNIKKGAPVSAEGFTDGILRMAHALENMSIFGGKVSWSSDGAPKIIPGSAGGSGFATFEAVAEYGDYLMCARVASYDANQHPIPVDPGEEDETLYKVWKPWLLRSTPFNGLTRDGITYAVMPSGYTYASGEANIRRATRVSDSSIEWQTITPPYSVRSESTSGELIYAMILANGEFLEAFPVRSWAVTDEPEAAT